MPAGREIGQLSSRSADAGGSRGVWEGNHAIGVADVESIAEKRHAERLVQPVEEHLADFGHAVAIRVP